ncbi:hypothetical protein BJY04DRAFT_227717 [Aspergillus karnatakaensis]|uniref:M20 family metallopeptidase n=1 Tax=Aspergillus karnatakaensis TaxID=1810916 RepID=UPI003CCE3CCB
MAYIRLLLASTIAGGSAFVLPFSSQNPLAIEDSSFKCDLPPILDPSSDGLPSAKSLFSSQEALHKQVERHSAIVQVPSVCWDDMGEIDEDPRWNPFYRLLPTLQKSYPKVNERVKLETINKFGLLYTINGTDPTLKPTLLMAHQDVVPVADPSTWTHPPFSGYFDGEWIWGRGSSDDKNSLTGILSAVEALVSNSDWNPRRTVLLAFGFDEECTSNRGAGPISDLVRERYGEDSLAIIVDEGGAGTPPLDDKVLYVHPAITEKGYINLEFKLHARGGHSSVPLPHTSIGIISELVVALEENPYEPVILPNSPIHNRLVCQARYSPGTQPEVEAKLKEGDFKGLAEEYASTSSLARYVVQTSQAVDLIEGGVKINAMPEVVTVTVNYRVAHHERPVDVQHRAVKVISEVVEKYNLRVEAYKGDKEYDGYLRNLELAHEQGQVAHLDLKRDIEVDYNGTLVISAPFKAEPVTPSPVTGGVWEVFSGTIQHSFAVEDKVVIPIGDVMTGGTDTRHYLGLTPNVYRFTPAVNRGLGNIHTVDERVNIHDHLQAVRFYYDLIRNLDVADV